MLNDQRPKFVCHKCDKGCQFVNHFGVTQKCTDNPTITDIVREVSRDVIGEKDVSRKRLWHDCAGLNAADNISNSSKCPKIQSLLDEIFNDNST